MPEVVVVRRTLQSVRRTQAELATVPELFWGGGTDDLQHAATLLKARQPQLLLCDLRLVDGTVLHLLRKLQKQGHGLAPARSLPRVLVLTPSADESLLFDTLRAGAHAYAVDDSKPAALSRAARELLEGRAAMSPMIARQMLDCFGVQRSPLQEAVRPPPHWTAPQCAQLAEADRRLLSLLAHGLLAVEVARCWNQTLEQVGRRIAVLYRKLHDQQDLAPEKGPDTTPDPVLQPATA
jgi:DNA-binding NarL/FixJ family response regulator